MPKSQFRSQNQKQGVFFNCLGLAISMATPVYRFWHFKVPQMAKNCLKKPKKEPKNVNFGPQSKVGLFCICFGQANFNQLIMSIHFSTLFKVYIRSIVNMMKNKTENAALSASRRREKLTWLTKITLDDKADDYLPYTGLQKLTIDFDQDWKKRLTMICKAASGRCGS